MVWTYDTQLTADKDKVRLLIGDTNSADQQLDDDEIAFLLLQEGHYLRAAVASCEAVAARYARDVDVQTDKSLQLLRDQRQKHYLDLAKRLRQRALRHGALPLAGGISQSDKQTREDNPDRVMPSFQRGMETEPGTESETNEPVTWQPVY